MIDARSEWTRALLMHKAISHLETLNIGDAVRKIEWIFCELLNCNRAALYAHSESTFSPDLLASFQVMLDRLAHHEPLQYILGYTEFCGIRFDVSPAVLIPRPETELLVEHAVTFLKDKPNPQVLDIGSGSGCIPISIKHFAPHAGISSCDVSEEAIEVAKSNAKQAGTAITFFHCDILTESLPQPVPQSYDLIVSNPPYIPKSEYHQLDPEVRQFEPEQALNAGEDPLLFYRSIGRVASSHLKPGGQLLFETHCDYARDVAALLSRHGFSTINILKDLTGRDRFVQSEL